MVKNGEKGVSLAAPERASDRNYILNSSLMKKVLVKWSGLMVHSTEVFGPTVF